MEKLYLPYVNQNSTIETALKRLRETDSRAIVVAFAGNDRRLYTNEKIVRAYAAKKSFCSQLRAVDDERVALLDTAVPHLEQVAVTTDAGDDDGIRLESLPRFEIESELDEKKSRYGILRPPSDLDPELDIKVMVFTRREDLKYFLTNLQKSCVCSGPDRHVDKGPPKKTGDACDFCQFTYTCC